MKCAGEEIAEDAAVINIIFIGLIHKNKKLCCRDYIKGQIYKV